MNRLLILACLACFASALFAQTTKPTDPKPDNVESELPADGTHPVVEIHTTLGVITLELDAQKAPVTVENFISYAKEGYFAGTIFHRVMKNFMIQGGGYDKDLNEKKEGLRGGILNEWDNGLKNDNGTIAMARLGGQPNSATAQFFINVVNNPRLSMKQRDGAGYAVFGKVTGGMDVVNAIRDTPVDQHPKLAMGPVVPQQTVEITEVKLVSEDYDSEAVAALVKKRMEGAAGNAAEEGEEAMRAGRAILEETGLKVQSTESGLEYVILEAPEGDTSSPTATSRVEVHYTGWLTDGTKFDSSVDRGQPLKFPLNGVIAGWTEGLQLMKVGERRKFLIPFELAYGARGRPPLIPARAPLIFDVELLGIE